MHSRGWTGPRFKASFGYIVSLCLKTTHLPDPPTNQRNSALPLLVSIEENVALKSQISLILEGKRWIGLFMLRSFRTSKPVMVYGRCFSTQDTEAEGLQGCEAILGYVVNSRLGRIKLCLENNKQTKQPTTKTPSQKRMEKKKCFRNTIANRWVLDRVFWKNRGGGAEISKAFIILAWLIGGG